jgi:hypothetical protein
MKTALPEITPINTYEHLLYTHLTKSTIFDQKQGFDDSGNEESIVGKWTAEPMRAIGQVFNSAF